MALVIVDIYFGYFKGLGVTKTGVIYSLVVLALCLVAGVAYGVRYSKFSDSRASYIDNQRKNGAPAVTQRLMSDARNDISSMVFEVGVLPVTRTVVDRWLTPTYDTTIGFSVPPSLSATLAPGDEVQTVALKKLQFLLRAMSGGSIGIAGRAARENRR